jgi:hypothetical protein
MRERIRIHRSKSHSVEPGVSLGQFGQAFDRHGPGQSLSSPEQSFLRARMGHDFSQVRIHADSKSDQLARAVHATAFTVGQDIFFRNGSYDPTTAEGTRLLTHEATHTVQQRGSESGAGRAAAVQQRVTISEPGDRSELEADAVAAAVSGGARSGTLPIIASHSSATTIQREEEEKKEPPPVDANKAADGAPAAPNPMMVAMFRGGVVSQLDAARATLGEKKLNIPAATVRLESAQGVLANMTDSARTGGNEALAANCSNARNILAAEGIALDAHIGIKVPVSEVRDNIDTKNEERIGLTIKRIEGML